MLHAFCYVSILKCISIVLFQLTTTCNFEKFISTNYQKNYGIILNQPSKKKNKHQTSKYKCC